MANTTKPLESKKVVKKITRVKTLNEKQPFKPQIEEINKPQKTNNFLTNLKKYTAWMALIGALVLLFWGVSKFMVVAWVNKKPITRVEYYNLLEQKDGQKVKEQLIKDRLLTDEAAKNKVNITQDEINQEITKIESQVGGKDQLNQELGFRGITEKEFIQSIKNNLIIQKLFGQEINISDDDITKFIEQNKAQLPDPVDDPTKTQIKDYLKQQKVQEKYDAWLQSALNSRQVVR